MHTHDHEDETAGIDECYALVSPLFEEESEEAVQDNVNAVGPSIEERYEEVAQDREEDMRDEQHYMDKVYIGPVVRNIETICEEDDRESWAVLECG